MANLVKKAFSSLLDKIGSTAQVLDVRAWEPRTLYELDLHLPTVNMAKWTTVPRLKCRVGELEFRDYTPAAWNVAQRTCTLYIEAGHQGAGSRWIQQLRKGDAVMVGPAHAEKLPAVPGPVLALGDGSALGHLLALLQLTNQEENPLDACVALHDDYQIPAPLQQGNTAIELLTTTNVQATLEHCLAVRPLESYSSIYLAGNMGLVANLRRQLKARPEVKARFYVAGFWK